MRIWQKLSVMTWKLPKHQLELFPRYAFISNIKCILASRAVRGVIYCVYDVEGRHENHDLVRFGSIPYGGCVMD
jgi:hypothetical protein